MVQLTFVLIAPILIYAAYSDLRWLRIPNTVSLLMLVVFALLAVVLPWPELLWRISISATVFAIGVVMFSVGLIGAGDVKLFSVLLLFVPPLHSIAFFQLFAVSLLMGVAFISACRRLPVLEAIGWRSIVTCPPKLPLV